MDDTKTEKHNLYHNHERRCSISIRYCGRTQEENIRADDMTACTNGLPDDEHMTFETWRRCQELD